MNEKEIISHNNTYYNLMKNKIYSASILLLVSTVFAHGDHSHSHDSDPTHISNYAAEKHNNDHGHSHEAKHHEHSEHEHVHHEGCSHHHNSDPEFAATFEPNIHKRIMM